jgi:hypothetical protein
MLINFNPFWGENAEVDKGRGAPKVILLIIGGTGATSILNTTHAQTVTLGESYFVEKGKITGQKELGPNRTQFNWQWNYEW